MHNARQRFQRRELPRRYRKVVSENDFHGFARLAQFDHKLELDRAVAAQMLQEIANGKFLRRGDRHLPRAFAENLVERLHGLDADLDRFSLSLALDLDQHVRACFELVTGGRQRVGENHGLELSGGIGESRKGEAVPGFRLAVLFVSDGCGETGFGAAMGFSASGKIAPAHDVQARELIGKVVQRMP